jgi:hypothetical protein
MTDRDRALSKIRALLQKTVANGCPVEEALAAHAKPQALIDKYQVSHEELYGTGPGPRWRKPEPESAEPKHEQQTAPEKPAGIGVLFPFWMRMATVVTVVWLIGWYVVWGQGIRDDIPNWLATLLERRTSGQSLQHHHHPAPGSSRLSIRHGRSLICPSSATNRSR